MKNYLNVALLSLSVLFASCSGHKNSQIASAKLFTTADNKEIGSAKFYEEENGQIKLDLKIDFPARADSTVAVEQTITPHNQAEIRVPELDAA